MAQSYKTGTVTVAAGSTSVVGAGTAWALALVTGGLFCCAGMAVPCTVIDDTHLELDYPWPGANGADLAYSIFRETAQAASAIEANDRLASIADRLNKLSYINFDAMGTLAQRAAYDTAPKDFIFLDVTTEPFELYIKASDAAGDWAGPNVYGQGARGEQGPLTPFLFVAPEALAPGSLPTVSNTGTPTAPKMKFGIPAGRGFYSKGDYAAGTTYQPDDVVLFAGSSWIALQETTGNTPPALPATENAWWRLIARHGNDGQGTVTELVSGNLVDINSTDPTKPVVSLKSMASQRILGRQAAGVGDVELLTGDQVRGIATAARDTFATNTEADTDWDTIVSPGFHPRLLGINNPNAPVSSQYFYCDVKRYSTDQNLIQIAYPYRNSTGGIWYRIRAAGSWGQWVQVGSDAITRITNANGTATRLPDGTQICTKKLTGLGPVSLAWGNVFWNNNTHNIGNWAAEFIEVPAVSGFKVGGIRPLLIGASSNEITTTDGGSLVMMSGTAVTESNFVVSITAIGRYK
ncbi:hypothetical protein C7441_1163 [Pseudaminobacter salicylatoxidans]|uniref:Tail fiber protein n=1 Tax=Pseudaminobacter salicylatoxidans TaxID=93369 RepID=A0A316BVP0_PSESE|nr:pyocin knob domain-containing protein [Pseudaminobacter salicylatoxidans]PWJ78338.1 hypothetical protein C7441_1163 [Pseudaminobacter salicylatoxidans]